MTKCWVYVYDVSIARWVKLNQQELGGSTLNGSKLGTPKLQWDATRNSREICGPVALCCNILVGCANMSD